MSTYVINKTKYQGNDEKFNFNTQTELNPEATLREIKKQIGSTRGYKKAPGTRYLRCCEDIVAATTAAGCRMEIYKNGFAIYQTADTAAVIRMEYVGKARYDGDPNIALGNQNIDLMDEAWKIAVMISGEERLEKWAGERDADTLLSLSDAGEFDEETGGVDDMEINAGVDIEEEYLEKEEASEVLKLLSQRQCECAGMHYGLGMTEREIAAVLGTSYQNVDQTLRRAKTTTKIFLKKFEAAG